MAQVRDQRPNMGESHAGKEVLRGAGKPVGGCRTWSEGRKIGHRRARVEEIICLEKRHVLVSGTL